MNAAKNIELLRLLAAQPMLTEAEARRELGLPESPPDREDRQDKRKSEPEPVKSSGSPVAAVA